MAHLSAGQPEATPRRCLVLLRYVACSALLTGYVQLSAQPQPAAADEVLPPDHQPKMCVQSESAFEPNVSHLTWACKDGSVVVAAHPPVRIAGDRIGLRPTCCRLPAGDILDTKIGYYSEACPAEHVVTGVLPVCTADDRLHDFAHELVTSCAKALRCVRINTERYQLSPPTPGAYWGSGSSYWQYSTRYTRLDIPAALRSAVGRITSTVSYHQGCVGSPFGSVLVQAPERWCSGYRFRQLQFRGRGQDPAEGTPLQMFPRCDAVLDIFDPDSPCIVDGRLTPTRPTDRVDADQIRQAPYSYELGHTLAELARFASEDSALSLRSLREITALRDAAEQRGDREEARRLDRELKRADRFVHLYLEADIRYVLGKTVEATEYMLQAYNTGVRDPGLDALAIIALKELQYPFDASASVSLVEQVHRKTAKSLRLLSDLTQMFYAQGNSRGATTSLRRMKDLGHDSLELRLDLASHTWMMGDTQEALELLEETIRTFPENAAAYSRLAELLGGAGRCNEAEINLRRAMKIDRTQRARWRDIWNCYLTAGADQDAARTLEHAIELGDHSYDVYLQLGTLSDRLGRPQAAIEYLREATALEQDGDLAPYYQLADIYRTQSRLTDAFSIAQQALQKYPESSEAVALAAELLKLMGCNAEANEHFARALLLEHQSDGSLYVLARHFANIGEHTLAVELLRRFAELGVPEERFQDVAAEIISLLNHSNQPAGR